MDRRHFLSSLLTGAAAGAAAVAVGPVLLAPSVPLIQPATGSGLGIVGVAVKDVRAGDFVEAIRYGMVSIPVTHKFWRNNDRPVDASADALCR